ncbi:MlaE family lipid ABC transporter permease subunit [Pseudomonas nicosulfuronedens]|uniref:MlaE family lipid ABC transporter permease subunit n=1 Tax=Pseudomonas nicosulfuronedens TaxID=2571105 RepID=A0A5R9QMY4_9PSED|nr:MlaE family lipid ABC transporter permease subunit [Pseudomonas nicosulfuronedens]MDH1011656.1 MlaE family lipid ABC transporter permease subunit [Pseudomonas nicosulfuronedens]MDH1980355.1 MlaE family lipid ABC transporter permease subunit [Pseudomonas nicosulfuronedens]MDH2027393.1 MlaE family lipid ABC transporter permease subunit [Pseudomonas nicosulfuronedens]TLX70991.1 MlaE family lipid ABC transporter permease subunit [Pseudomonas nicosulfuronedens]
MTTTALPGQLQLDATANPPLMRISGDWTLAHFSTLEAQVAAQRTAESPGALDFAGLGALDTAGAALLAEIIGSARMSQLDQIARNLPAERQALLRTVGSAITQCRLDEKAPPPGNALVDVLERIGIASVTFKDHLIGVLGFIGLTLQTLLRNLLRPRRWRLTSLAAHMEETGLDAVPIVALLTFMVGAVVAFLGATVLQKFGAAIYTVDLVGFSFLREFGVLLTAILIAGRTASAFTAQIGSMKANQEIDAIQALGLDPVELLVLPRVLALLLTLPMLTFLAMISGIFGGGVVCALSLDISPRMFLYMLQNDIAVQHFLVGIVKAPVFAFIIAVIGCLEGFRVSGSAQSVGEHTTSSVVQSIFVVILLDAMFALFFMEMGW